MKPSNALKRFAFSRWLNRPQMPMKSWCLVVEWHDFNEMKCEKRLTVFKTCIVSMSWHYLKNTHFENPAIVNDSIGFTQSMLTTPTKHTIGNLSSPRCSRIHDYLDSILDCLQPYLDPFKTLRKECRIGLKYRPRLSRQTVKVNGVSYLNTRWFEHSIMKTRPLILWRCLWKERKTLCRLWDITWTSVQWTFLTHFQTTRFWCLVKPRSLNPLHRWRMSFHRWTQSWRMVCPWPRIHSLKPRRIWSSTMLSCETFHGLRGNPSSHLWRPSMKHLLRNPLNFLNPVKSCLLTQSLKPTSQPMTQVFHLVCGWWTNWTVVDLCLNCCGPKWLIMEALNRFPEWI